MPKRIISLSLALYAPMLLLYSCFDGEPSPAPESSSKVSASVTEYKTFMPKPDWYP